MSESRNAGKKLVRHQKFFHKSIASVRHRHSGIKASPETLITDLSAIVQLCSFAITTEFFYLVDISWPPVAVLFLRRVSNIIDDNLCPSRLRFPYFTPNRFLDEFWRMFKTHSLYDWGVPCGYLYIIIYTKNSYMYLAKTQDDRTAYSQL